MMNGLLFRTLFSVNLGMTGKADQVFGLCHNVWQGNCSRLSVINELLNSKVACSPISADRRNLDESQCNFIFCSTCLFGHFRADRGNDRSMARGG